MSIDRCQRCGDLVDTDDEPEAYVQIGNMRQTEEYICLCRRHREEREDERSEPANLDAMISEAIAADMIEALSAPAVTVTEGWQPIETAPKDGSEVIGVYFHDENPELIWGPWTMAWRKNEWVPSWDRRAVVDYMSDFGTDYKDLDASPTHWQPLPPPPSTTPQTGSQE